MFDANLADGVVHDLRIDPEQRRQFIPGEVEENPDRCQLFHHFRRDVQKRAKGMIDHGALEPDLVHFLGEPVNLRVGRVAEK